MGRFIVRRTIGMLFVLFAVSVIVFLITFTLALVYIRLLGAELTGARR